jgi:hypothetical protein
MAARRLLIVMLILLGLSTLAAALVPQHALRDATTGSTTATQPTTTTTPEVPAGRSLSVKIGVGGKKVPVVANPICKARKPRCEPLHVGDQLSLKVLSKEPAELEIPTFGLIGVASDNSPAFFQLLPREATTIGVLFTSPPPGQSKIAAKITVLSAKDAAKAMQEPKKKENAKTQARAESGPA